MTELPGTAAERLEALKDALAASPLERLKWRVLRTFGALPNEWRARRMRDMDYLWCGLNLLLDAEERMAGELAPPVVEIERTGGQNAAFDEERYLRLSRGERA